MVSEDISGRKREKKERQTEESKLMMKREEARLKAATLSGDAQGQREMLTKNKRE